MAGKAQFVVQVFVKKRGQVVPGDRELSPTESGARKRAGAMAARELGVAALKIEADPETGEVTRAEILEQHGEVPEDFADTLRGG